MMISAFQPTGSVWFRKPSLQGCCCQEPSQFSLLPFPVSEFGENQLISPSVEWGKNPCSTETKGRLYPAWHWERLNGATTTCPRGGCGAGYQTHPPPRRARHGVHFPSATPEGDVAGCRAARPQGRRSVPPECFSSTWGRGMAAAAAVGVRECGRGRSGPGSPRPEGGGSGGFPVGRCG